MRLLAPLCLLVLLAAPAHAQITNGGLEPAGPAVGYALLPTGSTTIPGWTTMDSGVEWFLPSAAGYNNSPQGGDVVDLANYTFSAGGIRQTFATLPGQAYEISFYLGTHAVSGRNGTCEIVVAADGATQGYSHASLTTLIGWSPRSFTFVADDASATLSFRCLQNANLHFAYIDGIGAQLATPAETATWGSVKAFYRR